MERYKLKNFYQKNNSSHVQENNLSQDYPEQELYKKKENLVDKIVFSKKVQEI